MTRCAMTPSNKSRTIARATTLPAPPAKPCTPRKNHKVSTLGAKAQPSEAKANMPSPHLMVLNRPIASDTAP